MRYLTSIFSKKILVFLLPLLLFIPANGQEVNSDFPVVDNPPIDVIGLFGNKGMFAEIQFDKKFQSIPKLGFFAVANVFKEWDESDITDLMNQAALTYEFAPGFNLALGYQYTPFTSIRASASVSYVYASDQWLVVLAPRIDLSKDATYEMYTNVIYHPRLNENLNLYTRLSAMYNMTVKGGEHQRSYAWLRAGLEYKEFAFGLGANIDFFGPEKENINNFGVFIGIDLF